MCGVSKPIDAWRAFYHRAWWLVPEIIALITVGVMVPSAGFGITRPADPLRAALAEKIVSAMEHATPEQHHDHGHDRAATMACVVEVYGFDPADATSVGAVRTAYGYLFCAAGTTGIPYDFAAKLAGPVAADIGAITVVHIAQSGLGYPERVRELMPDRYEQVALAGFTDHSIAGKLRPRYDAAVGNR
jgi:hypothetical protein